LLFASAPVETFHLDRSRALRLRSVSFGSFFGIWNAKKAETQVLRKNRGALFMTTSKPREHVKPQPEHEMGYEASPERATFRQDSKKWMDYAAHKAKLAFGHGKDRFIEELGDVADVMREGAAHLEETERASASYIEGGAERVERMRENLKHRDAEDLIEELSAFARRHPSSFLLGSGIVGFSIIRLLRSVDYQTVEVLDTGDGTEFSEAKASHMDPA
jgi:hypothetical protein